MNRCLFDAHVISKEWGRVKSGLIPVEDLDSGFDPPYLFDMALTFDALTRDAMILPPEQRVALAHRLLRSVEPEPDTGAEATWEEEIATRIARSDAGETTPISAAEVFARLRRLAPDPP